MRDISLVDVADKLPVFTFLGFGDTRSGKTHWAATMPRPFVYADIAESGYKTIMSMDRDLWFEPDVEPIVVGIDTMNDIAASQQRLDALIASKRVMSVVFDAFSFYTDFFLANLFRLQTKPDNRTAYGDLGKHLREVRTILGTKGVNVFYGCLAKHPDTDDPKGRPLIPGQQADKFSAGVDFLWHFRLNQIREAGKIVDEIHEIHTRQYNGYIAGNRLGTKADQLPNPLVGTYSDFLSHLGYDVEAIRKSLPKIQAAPRVIAQPTRTVVSPPVARTTSPASRVVSPVTPQQASGGPNRK